jgi:uncharacterized protein YdaT
MASLLARTPNHTATSNPPKTHTDVDATEERKNHHIEFAYLDKDKRDSRIIQPRKGMMTRRQARQSTKISEYLKLFLATTLCRIFSL